MKRTYIVCLLCCIILGASLAGCGAAAQTAPQSTVSSAVSEAPISEPAAAEEDVIIRAEEVGEFVTGLEDHIVVQDAKNINYLHDVAYDPSIVREVAQNDEAVDPSVPGTYRITYKVVIDKEAYRKFRNGEDVPASSEEASSRPAPTPLPDVKEPVVEDKGDVIEILPGDIHSMPNGELWHLY